MTPSLDWPALQDDAVRLLRALIRFDTTNPPGNETPAARRRCLASRPALGYNAGAWHITTQPRGKSQWSVVC